MATASKTRQAPNAPTEMVPVDSIIPPDINRDEYGDIKELSESIKQQGLLQAITVAAREDGKYDLIMGERRLRATRLAGFNAIEAKVVTLDPVERVFAQLSENIHRKELAPLERARQIDKLFAVASAQKQKMTQQTAAERLGLSGQSQISKYRTLYRMYEGVTGFKSAYNAGTVTISDAVELGKLSKTPESDADFITRVMTQGIDKGNMPQAVKHELDVRARNQKRAAKQQELKSAGATIAPDDFHKQGGRRLGPGSHELNVDADKHAGQSCHAVYVTATLEVQSICMEPKRHKDSKPAAPSKSAVQKSEPATDATPASAPTDDATPDTTAEAEDAPSGDQAAAELSEEEQAKQRAEAEEREAENAARAAHEEALRETGVNRRALLRSWLTGKSRLNRPLTDGYVFGQVVAIALSDDDVDQGILRELLELPEDDTDVFESVRQMASQNEEQLRRVAVALLCERVETALEHDTDYQNAMADQHYLLLTDALKYEPSEEEQIERSHPVTKANAA